VENLSTLLEIFEKVLIVVHKLWLLIHTIRFLKFKQIYFRIFYLIRKKCYKVLKFKYPLTINSVSHSLFLPPSIILPKSYNNQHFQFLNLAKEFKGDINWDYIGYGKLWTYNLNYFEYLQQEELKMADGIDLIHNFIKAMPDIKIGLMPFPISLRGINWIKFLSKHEVRSQTIDDALYAQYFVLLDNIEYHILGNHLLENGFSLLFGAYYFREDKFYVKAREILLEELEEQVLEDGAHFELSPMYHQLMLFRVLDCINLVKNSPWKHQELLTLLTQKAEIMLGWLDTMSYTNGEIPLFNDSAKGIAPTTQELFEYAQRLNIAIMRETLSESGYRKRRSENYECVVDVGDIGPDYIPGHAHSDTFNFELYVENQPVIVDTGISTYENNEERTLERSTISHNTVEIDGQNQTEVWGGFRVAQRAKIIDLIETEQTIEATHDGYKRLGCLHTRKWHFFKNKIEVLDTITGETSKSAIAYLHFHPNIKLEIIDNVLFGSLVEIHFKNIENLSLTSYNYSNIFNQKKTSNVLRIEFNKSFSMEIKIL
jgi:hypothetical protein